MKSNKSAPRAKSKGVAAKKGNKPRRAAAKPRTAAGPKKPRERAATTAIVRAEDATKQRFVENLLTRGEAAKPDASGNLPAGATHEIVSQTPGRLPQPLRRSNGEFRNPSKIEALLIPRALAGVDVLGQARTGTGKTAGFGIPILQRATKGLATQAIILVPTRELCIQVDTELKRLSQHTPIRVVPVYGGQKIPAQMKLLKHGPENAVGTPGPVMDLLERPIIH